MYKIRLFLIITLILFFGQNLYSQKIFREGFVVKKSGQLLNGLVEYSANQDVPSICAFKRFDIARRVVYSPDDILIFGYNNGNRYETKKLGNKISFYEVLVTGKIKLYRKGSRYYLDKDQSGFVELKNGLIIWDGSAEKMEFNSLTEFLRFITEAKTGNIPEKFNLKTDITPLVISYNKQSGSDYSILNRSITEKQLSQQSIKAGAFRNKFGILTGADVYLLKMKPLANNYVPDPETETAFITGITYERLILRKSDKLSLRIDLLFNKQTFYSYQEETLSSRTVIRHDAFFNYTGIKIPVLIQYSITAHKIVPYMNLGIGFQVFRDKDYLHIEETENYMKAINTSEERNMFINNSEFSAIAGIGVKIRVFNNLNLNLEGRIEYGQGLFAPVGDSYHRQFSQSSLQAELLLGITF